jgi:hypothetical protein
MDPVKKAFVKEVQDAIKKMIESGMTSVANAYGRTPELYSTSFEFQEVTDLECRVRIKQGPRGPRYFSVIVKERI